MSDYKTTIGLIVDTLGADAITLSPCRTKEVPVIPTEKQWGGLARDIVMWIVAYQRPTGKELYAHLTRLGRAIPDWLREEVPDIDHVPPKGSMAAIIYRAMVEAA